jgi:hypothetical protein
MGPIPIKPAPRALQGIEIATIFFNKKISDTQWVPIEYTPCIVENKVKMPAAISNNATHTSMSLMFFKMAHNIKSSVSQHATALQKKLHMLYAILEISYCICEAP